MTYGRRALAVTLLVGLVAGRASAATGLLPVKVTSGDPARTGELRSSLEIEIGDVLKRRLVKVAPPRTCGDSFSERCALDVIAESGVSLDEVALVEVSDRDGDFVVEVNVRETSEGKLVFRESVRQRPADGPGVVAAVLRRAFDAKAWSGRIVVAGAPAGAEVLVDGLPVTGPSIARAGPHTVVVRTPDGFESIFDVVAEPGAVTTVDVGAPPAVAAGSLLPALALGGLGTAATGVAAVFASALLAVATEVHEVSATGDASYTLDRTQWLAREARLKSASNDLEPTGRGWEVGYGSKTKGTTTPTARLAQVAAVHAVMVGDQAIGTIDTYAAIAAGAVAVASFVGCFLAWPSVPDEGAEGSAAAP